MASSSWPALSTAGLRRFDLWLTRPSLGRTALWFVAIGGGLLWCVALLLLARRIGGGLVDPLTPVAAFVLALALGAAVLLIRAAATVAIQLDSVRSRAASLALLIAAGAACLALALIVTLPGQRAAAAVALYLPLLLVETSTLALSLWLVRDGSRRWPRWIADRPTARVVASPPPMDVPRDEPGEGELLPSGVTQRLVRSRTATGQDAMHGTLRVQFAARQRTEIVHVAFCPPFEVTPEWTAKAESGPALTIKQVQVFPYGARLELRLGEIPRAATEAIVAFRAVERGIE
jgi:hypothetical protein